MIEDRSERRTTIRHEQCMESAVINTRYFEARHRRVGHAWWRPSEPEMAAVANVSKFHRRRSHSLPTPASRPMSGEFYVEIRERHTAPCRQRNPIILPLITICVISFKVYAATLQFAGTWSARPTICIGPNSVGVLQQFRVPPTPSGPIGPVRPQHKKATRTNSRTAVNMALHKVFIYPPSVGKSSPKLNSMSSVLHSTFSQSRPPSAKRLLSIQSLRIS